MCTYDANFLGFNSDGNTDIQYVPNKYNFFGRIYAESLWFSEKNVFLLARKNIRQLAQSAFIMENLPQGFNNYSDIRTNVCEFLSAVRTLILSPGENDLPVNVISFAKAVSHDVIRLTELPFSASSYKLIMEHNSSYNYLHLLLNIYWFRLTVEHNIDKSNAKLEIFEKNLNMLLNDLIDISFRIFDRTNHHSDLLNLSPFFCPCFKDLWLLIQLYVEKLNNDHFCKDFWDYFNVIIKNNYLSVTDLNGSVAVKCVWLLYHIGQLHGLNANGLYIGPSNCRVISNYTLVDQCLRIITNAKCASITEQLLCSFLHLIAAFQFTWWKQDASFVIQQALWEYFYRQFNTSFTRTEENGFDFVQKSYDYHQLTKKILQYDFTDSSLLFTSYDLFLCLLVKYLELNPSHWPKLKGRIYSKLLASKLELFTNHGLHNLTILFLVLANTVNFSELTDKLQTLLNHLPIAKAERNSVVWSANTSLILMRVERRISLDSEMSVPFIQTVNSVSLDNSSKSLMQIYIDGLKKIVELNQELHYQERILLNNWISRYLKWCSQTDARYLLVILRKFAEKINHCDKQHEWWMIIEHYVVPIIVIMSSTSDVLQEVTDVGSIIVASDIQRFKSLLDRMLGEEVNVKFSTKFLKSLLMQDNVLQVDSSHQTNIIQAWIRIAVLNVDKTDLIELTQLIIRLSKWPEIVGSIDIQSTEDPLYAVIRVAGHRIRNAQTIVESSILKKWFETYFGKFDFWASSVIATAEREENTQLVLRIYTCTALMFLHCAPALYVKNKNTCLLYRLTTTLLLPPTLLMNKKPSNIILAALKRTWHIFVRGIARLGYKTDNYVERILKEMAIRYLPYMFDSTSPLLRCLDQEFENDTTNFLLDKICATYLPCKQKIPEFCERALKLIHEMSRTNMKKDKMLILIDVTFPYLIEHLAFSENTSFKNSILQIIKSIESYE